MRFSVIYADPPWDYGSKTKTIQGLASRHYPVMKVEDICKLLVGSISERDCALFLWVTPPHLKSGIKVMESWGFKYGTIAFVWIKTNKNNGKPFFGIGHWTASNCELVLVGLKVGGRLTRANKDVSQVVVSPRREHSRKPDEVRDRIARLMGDVPRIELFASEFHEDWFCIGNAVTHRDIRDDIADLIREKW